MNLVIYFIIILSLIFIFIFVFIYNILSFNESFSINLIYYCISWFLIIVSVIFMRILMMISILIWIFLHKSGWTAISSIRFHSNFGFNSKSFILFGLKIFDDFDLFMVGFRFFSMNNFFKLSYLFQLFLSGFLSFGQFWFIIIINNFFFFFRIHFRVHSRVHARGFFNLHCHWVSSIQSFSWSGFSMSIFMHGIKRIGIISIKFRFKSHLILWRN